MASIGYHSIPPPPHIFLQSFKANKTATFLFGDKEKPVNHERVSAANDALQSVRLQVDCADVQSLRSCSCTQHGCSMAATSLQHAGLIGTFTDPGTDSNAGFSLM